MEAEEAVHVPRADELVPHSVEEQLPNVTFCLTNPPPWPEAILVGFQHYLVMLGTTVIIPSALIPQMGGTNEDKAKLIQTSLFLSGINTLLQTLLGTRLPAVIGSSCSFVVPTISIILSGRYSNISDPKERFMQVMRGTQGALIVASVLPIVLGFGGIWCNVTRRLSPLAAVPVVTLVGIGLYELGFPLVAKCVEIGLPQLILLVLFSQYLPNMLHRRRDIFNGCAVILSVAIVWFFAFVLTVGGAYKKSPLKTQLHCRTDRSGLVSAAPWISIPYPFQWGVPMFHGGEAFAMMAAAFVALVESTGAFIAISRYAGATPMPPCVLSRGIGFQGIAVLLDGLFGAGIGSSVSVENAGLMGLTNIGSRRVVRISAGFMIFFSIFGKIGAIFASIPAPIFAAIYCLLFAYTGAAGLGFLQFCNLNTFRTLFILGFSIFLGLSIPQYFNEHTSVTGYGPVHTGAQWFNDMVNVVFSSKAVVAGLVAFFLDNTIQAHGGPMVRRDRGQPWWDKFRSFRTDIRTSQSYSLPCNVTRFLPYR